MQIKGSNGDIRFAEAVFGYLTGGKNYVPADHARYLFDGGQDPTGEVGKFFAMPTITESYGGDMTLTTDKSPGE